MAKKEDYKNTQQKPLPKNAYDNLFIPKQKAYENLFVGGINEKISQTPQHFCIYSNYEEIEKIEEKNK